MTPLSTLGLISLSFIRTSSAYGCGELDHFMALAAVTMHFFDDAFILLVMLHVSNGIEDFLVVIVH